jgi:SAM-dependent methyltransferase
VRRSSGQWPDPLAETNSVGSVEPYTATARAYDLLYHDKDYRGEVDEIAVLVDARRPGATSVLDVGCGTGAHLEWFARRFDQAVGIEANVRMIEEATIAREGLLVLPGDMRTFALRERFDVVTCLFSAIGYMTSVADLRRAVANMATHLTPGGVLVVEGWVSPDDWIAGRASAAAAVADDLAVARVVVSDREGDVSTVHMHYVLATVDGVERVDEVHRLGLFGDDQYRAAFEAAGLAYERCDGLTGRGVHVGVAATSP